MEELQKVSDVVICERLKDVFLVRHNIWFLILTGICMGMFAVWNIVDYELFFVIRYFLYAILIVLLLIYLGRVCTSDDGYLTSDIGALRLICKGRNAYLSKKMTEKVLKHPREWLHIFLKVIGGMLIALGIVAIFAQVGGKVDALLHIGHTMWLCYWILALAVFVFSVSRRVHILYEAHEWFRKNQISVCEACGSMFTVDKVNSSYRTVVERKKQEEQGVDNTVGYIGVGEDRIPITKTEHIDAYEYDSRYLIEDIIWECKVCGHQVHTDRQV